MNEEINDKSSGYMTILGPSFENEIPNVELWNSFVENIKVKKCKDFASLWMANARAAGGIPLRNSFGFKDMVKYGANIFMCKREENNRWIITFCGTDIVDKTGIESTGMFMDEFADPDTFEFWQKSIDILTIEKKPVIEFMKLDFVDKDFINCLSINFPLKSAPDIEPDIFFSYDHFTDEPFIHKVKK